MWWSGGPLLGAGRPPALEGSGRACLTLTCRLGRQHPVTTGLRRRDQQRLCQEKSRRAGRGFAAAAAVRSRAFTDFPLDARVLHSWTQTAAVRSARIATSYFAASERTANAPFSYTFSALICPLPVRLVGNGRVSNQLWSNCRATGNAPARLARRHGRAISTPLHTGLDHRGVERAA